MSFDWFDDHPQLWEWLVAKPIGILVLVVIAIVLRWIAHRLIDRLTQRAARGRTSVMPHAPGHEPREAKVGERRKQRSETVGSLLKSVTTGLISAIAVLMIIAQLGYNIAPLIASAGIVGLAIGFGAQALVKDFLSGIFMMIEDQYGVGDIVDVGEAVGEIESVGLRVTRLRDVDGTVWYVRNGEILRIGNMSQNWSRTVLDVAVGYGEDLARVRDVLSMVAGELYEDPAYRRIVLEPPEVWGVQSLDRDAVLIRVALKTAPMEQWGVARELRERIKARFDELGITIPNWPSVFMHTETLAASKDPSSNVHEEQA